MVALAYAGLTFVGLSLVYVYVFVLRRAGASAFDVLSDSQSFASRFDDDGNGKNGGRRRTPLTKEHAFDLLFKKNKSREAVRRWLQKLGREDEDAVQAVFLAAFESFDRYDSERARPERWLNKIAVNVAAHLNDKAYQRRESHEDELPDEPDERPGVEEQMEQEEDRLYVLEKLQKVDLELRTVLVAHDLDGIPMGEIAEQYGIPLSTAYKWRARAMAAFKEVVQDEKRAGPARRR